LSFFTKNKTLEKRPSNKSIKYLFLHHGKARRSI
jgi:hypothetical protein